MKLGEEKFQVAELGQEGAVLILLALIASILFAFIALGIDTGLLSVSRRDHSNMAPKVASAALNAFSNSTGADFDAKMNDARSRAEEIAQVAIDVATTSYLYKGGAYTAELGSVSTPGETGYIEAGIWHFVPTFKAPYFDPSGACTKVNTEKCPCDSGVWAGPCFEKLSASDFTPPSDPSLPFDPPKVSAIRVKLHTRDDSPLQARFAQTFGGQSSFYLEASATVAARPMRVVYIMDLSRSAHQETHLPFEIVGVMDTPNYNASEYAFKITNKSCKTNEPPPPNDSATNDTAYVTRSLTCEPVDGLCGTVNKTAPLGPSDCRLEGGLAFSGVGGTYNALFNHCNPFVYPPGKPAATSKATWHSKADYRCVTIAPDIKGVAQGSEHYLVDAFRNNNYRGPEPLTTFMHAIRRGIQRFDSRNIDSDRIGIIGVDHEAQIDQRTFALSSPNSSDTVYQKIKQVFAANADFNLRHKDHIWFPRRDAMFNLPDALRAAYTMLTSDPEFHYSDNHIILLSDGVSECYLDDNTNKQVCSPEQAAIEESLGEALQIAQTNFVDSNIRLNVILLGDMIAPHSLLKKSKAPGNQNSCMDEDEARNTEDGGGNAEPWVNQSDNSATYREAFHDPDTKYNSTTGTIEFDYDARYFAPNQLHAAVAQTGGVWGVIRPTCQPTAAQLGGGSCQDGSFEDYLDTQCAAEANPGDLVTNLNGSSGTKITDADGRLLCDSKCRTREVQIEDYIDEIFDSFPYLAVQSNIQVN